MRITITHITRMHGGRVCVAGVDDLGQHVRVRVRYGALDRTCLAKYDGPFALGNVVDLGQTIGCGSAPEVEDCYVNLAAVRVLRCLAEGELWALLDSLAREEPKVIFGSALHTPEGHESCLATDDGCGRASLGVLRLAGRPVLRTFLGNAKLECSIDGGHKSFTVTDARLYLDDLETVDAEALHRMRSAVAASSPVLLCVGLTVPWRPPGESSDKHHWMQVNGIHPRPCGEREP